MMFDATILSQLQVATTAAVAASGTPTLPVKYVGIDFKPPNDQKYLEIVFIPNNRTGDHWDNSKNYMGIFRLVLHWPNDPRGAYPPMLALASIAGYFTKGLRLQNVRICENPNLTNVLEQGAENLYPASIRYNCFQ